MPAKNLYIGWVPVAHACNPSYSGDRDQEDRGSKPAGQTVLKTLCLKNPSQKRAGGVAQGVAPEFKPQYRKKREKEEEERMAKFQVTKFTFHNELLSVFPLIWWHFPNTLCYSLKVGAPPTSSL
jgi:hypothetical protein